MKILLILLKFNNMEIWKTITDYPCVNHKDEIKLKDNIIVKIKNNIVVETIK